MVFREATGFDPGSTHLSAVNLTKKGDMYRVENTGFIQSLNPVDDPDFGITFREFSRTKKLHPRNIILGLSGREVLIRYFKMPVVPDWKLEMMMNFEIDEQTSSFTKDSYWAFRKVNIPGIRKFNVMMIGVCTQDYIEFFLEHVPRIARFNLNSLALFSASLLSDQISEDDFSLLIDIGAYNTEVAVVQGNMLLFGRNIQYGANNFDDDIVTSLNTDISEAEKLKIERGCVRSASVSPEEPYVNDMKLNTSLTSTARMLYTHISSALQYCKEQIRFYDFDISTVYTTGGGSLLTGLNDFLQERFNIPVQHLEIADQLDLSRLSEEKQNAFKENIHSFTTAVGLAVSGIGSGAAVLDPMPKRIVKRRRFARKELYLITASFVFLLGLTAWGWFVARHNSEIVDDISRQKTLLTEAQNLKQKVNQEERLYERYSKMEKALKARVYSSTDMLVIFNILQKTLPDDIWITSFSTEDIGTIINGTPGTEGKHAFNKHETLQNRGTIYITGQVRLTEGNKLDPHQLLDDYTTRLANEYKQFSRFEPLVKEYSDPALKDKFFYKYRILISHAEDSDVLEK